MPLNYATTPTWRSSPATRHIARGSRGKSEGGPWSHVHSNETIPERNMKQDLRREYMQIITRPTRDDATHVDFVIKELTFVGSYSWADNRDPTIIVPGAPPIWQDKELLFRVRPDSGIRYIDQNGHRVPSSTLLPLFKAADVLEDEPGMEKVDWSNVDIVTDRNGLRKLLRWVTGVERDGRPVKDFRIDTQLGGKRTVLFSRWEKKTFEQGCAGATGHHRIIKYDFDGLILVVRFEVDACLDPTSKSNRTQPPDDMDDLSSLLSGLVVSSSPLLSTRPPGGSSPDEIKVVHAGCIVAQKDIVELTTRSQRNVVDFDWGDVYPQLFLSQTPHLYLAIHDRGNFEQVQKDVLGSPKMRRVERELNIGLKKLRSALETIQNLVIDHGEDGRLTLLCQEGELKVYERISNRSSLPSSIMSRFEM
ncbi:hypothetical protein C8Q75DRAFT_436081 [Abortiporus biennis]|nr:hypothetical protein C8Q75DRAFT_436081 [Abortiporus biennis]